MGKVTWRNASRHGRLLLTAKAAEPPNMMGANRSSRGRQVAAPADRARPTTIRAD